MSTTHARAYESFQGRICDLVSRIVVETQFSLLESLKIYGAAAGATVALAMASTAAFLVTRAVPGTKGR